MVKFVQKFVFISSSILLSACVTQNFDKDTPVIEQNSSNKELAMGRVTLGLGYLNMGNTTQTKFNLEKAKKFAPNLIEVYAAFAHYYETVDEPELAEQSFEKALSIKVNDANTLNNYGVFLCRQENYLKAEKQFLKAISIPSYLLVSESYENLASCQLKAGDFDKAERYLSKAITHSPNSGTAIFQMIQLEYAMGNYKKARRYTQKFEKVTRNFNPSSLAMALKVYQQLGNQKTARNYGSMLVSMHPESWEAKQYILNGLERIEADDLAEKYQEVRSKNKGEKSKKRVIVLSPNKSLTAQTKQHKAVESEIVVAKEASKPKSKALVKPATPAVIVDSSAESEGESNLTVVNKSSSQVSDVSEAMVVREVTEDNGIETSDAAQETIAVENSVDNTYSDDISLEEKKLSSQEMMVTTEESDMNNAVTNDELVAGSSPVTESVALTDDNIQGTIEITTPESISDQELSTEIE